MYRLSVHPPPTPQGGTAEVLLSQGDTIKLSIDKKYYECGDKDTIYVDYTQIVDTLSIGDLVYIDDGLISTKVVAKGMDYLMTGL